jgi:hypothetical protein
MSERYDFQITDDGVVVILPGGALMDFGPHGPLDERIACAAIRQCLADLAERDARIERVEAELERLRAQEPLFLLTTGAIDSSGEQDDWDIENYWRIASFCAAHPGEKINLYAEPMPAKGAK